MKVGQFINKAAHTVGKNSPLILTVAGVIGLGSTAVLAYKASKKVEVITERIEESREQEEKIAHLELLDQMDALDAQGQYELDEARAEYQPVSRPEVVKDIAGAVALPVVVGLLSVASIALSYHVLTNRNNMLATALGAAVAEHHYYKSRVQEMVTEEQYRELETPVRREEGDFKDADGKKIKEPVFSQVDHRSMTGEWFDQSSEHTVDDHSYNLMFIKAAADKLDSKMFRKGYLRMNEVFDELGFARTRLGESMGWTKGMDNTFELETTVTNVLVSDQGEEFVRPEIYINWPTPKPIYNEVDYEGRYA